MRVYEARMDHTAFRVERFIRAVCGEDPLLGAKRGNASATDGNSAARYDAVICVNGQDPAVVDDKIAVFRPPRCGRPRP